MGHCNAMHAGFLDQWRHLRLNIWSLYRHLIIKGRIPPLCDDLIATVLGNQNYDAFTKNLLIKQISHSTE
jgi:hypothetical protein